MIANEIVYIFAFIGFLFMIFISIYFIRQGVSKLFDATIKKYINRKFNLLQIQNNNLIECNTELQQKYLNFQIEHDKLKEELAIANEKLIKYPYREVRNDKTKNN